MLHICTHMATVGVEGLSRKLQHCAARVIYNCGRQDHVTPLLRDNLHWLFVRERILFKLCLMVYRTLSGLAPSYITELCVPVASIRPRSSLRSAAHGTLFVPRTRLERLELGKRAFAVAVPAAWNSLPDDVRSAPTLDKFKQCLKTHPYCHITHSLVELPRTTFPLCL